MKMVRTQPKHDRQQISQTNVGVDTTRKGDKEGMDGTQSGMAESVLEGGECMDTQ
jgi:hypothetical protein